jgi:hypothetical protein
MSCQWQRLRLYQTRIPGVTLPYPLFIKTNVAWPRNIGAPLGLSDIERPTSDMLLLLPALFLGGEEDELSLYAGVFRKEDSGLVRYGRYGGLIWWK